MGTVYAQHLAEMEHRHGAPEIPSVPERRLRPLYGEFAPHKHEWIPNPRGHNLGFVRVRNAIFEWCMFVPEDQ